MIGLSEKIIRELTEITNEESARLPQWIDKKYVASCIIPPLSRENDVHCNIAVVAPVSAGKSTLINALCGYPIMPVASKTTSSVPVYITRTNEQSQENVTVYGMKKEVTQKNGITSSRFVRDPATKRTYYAKDISKEMYDELFDYMYFAMHGTDLEYQTTIENVAYFMNTPELSDILFNGIDAQKRTISKEDFALSYSTSRHRLLLLLILLCVYVDQNDSEKNMSEYTKELNQQRIDLFKKYGFPTGSDYCVSLDWCNDDIPQNVTLIDLPGTGSSTEDLAAQSSHTALVRGILTEADAVWVLCSDNGTADVDLLVALKDTIEGNARKNKVCIYNCKNGKPNDSSPVIDFLKKIPCLTGERCYVVNALAGEYKYTQNGVNALMTKTASDMRCDDDDEPSENRIIKKLGGMYGGEKKAYCTFTTSKDALDHIVAVQDSDVRYTLDTFFKCALTEYVERLKYEVVLAQAIEQTKFYIYIRDSLVNSRGILESIDGKGEEISETVIEALESAKRQAFDNYITQMTKHQAELAKELGDLGEKLGEKIKAKFISCLRSLIADIKNDWRTLEQAGHPNCLVKGKIFSNYPLRGDHPNWSKFERVRKSAQNKITISAFDDAFKIANDETKKYKEVLRNYTNSLKKVTRDFVTDYINAFLSAFDQKRDEFCLADGSGVTDQVFQNFNSTREKLRIALLGKLNAMCVMVCDSFDILTAQNGILEQLCKETDKAFRDRFCEIILDKFRDFMYSTFTGTNYIGWIRDHMKPEDLHRILNDDFSRKQTEYTEDLSKLIDVVYGMIPEDENFPSGLSAKMNEFNGNKVMNGAVPEIENTHINITSLVGFGASIAVDLTAQINELNEAIGAWAGIGEQYRNIYHLLEDSDAENTKKLYCDCAEHIEQIIAGTLE